MALIGNMIATAVHGNHSIVNYDMFVAVFGMLSLLYLLAASFMDALAKPVIMIGLDAANLFFYLIAGIATAAYLGVHSCSNKVCFLLPIPFSDPKEEVPKTLRISRTAQTHLNRS